MIDTFEYPQYELRPGDSYELRVVAPEPISVEIKCFKSSPPPPGYRSCKECGSFRVRSGESLSLFVSRAAFKEVTGGIDVTVEDSTGDSRHVRLSVVTEEEERGQTMMAGTA
jgi:hypothetical protein